MKTKTIEVKAGEETNRLVLYRDLTEDLKPLFKQVDASEEFDRFFGGKTTVAAKSFKVTLTIEEL